MHDIVLTDDQCYILVGAISVYELMDSILNWTYTVFFAVVDKRREQVYVTICGAWIGELNWVDRVGEFCIHLLLFNAQLVEHYRVRKV